MQHRLYIALLSICSALLLSYAARSSGSVVTFPLGF